MTSIADRSQQAPQQPQRLLTMHSQTLFQQCRQAAGLDSAVAADPEALIGLFQTFRPDGAGLAGAFDGLAVAEELHDRLERLYHDCGDDRRPQGGRDAYFIVRKPEPLESVVAESAAYHWLENMRQLAVVVGRAEAVERLSRPIAVRVLEGIAPKHPKAAAEKSQLLRTFIDEVPEFALRLAGEATEIAMLRPAFYFIACDFALRDYLMWPLYRAAMETTGSAVDDPFAPYYTLWRHGVKYRIFGEDQIDLYIPRRDVMGGIE